LKEVVEDEEKEE